ncbi:hypothetical protein A6770_13085 [Nostoc minutum NIES-26]|uniref:DUF4335 domain-containing protein n=1 Tax=Nostoc minutum NIES-26 TaxID=1844469 RepID=A0A367RRG1_9NOSO|nr:hypothetical protein A6770_13085 [Nostoc minutum NIES-26]
MPLTNSVIRRYTPPTCTLEILAQSSPLSNWMGKTVLKQLSFELRFDDPQLPEERRVPIRGDRDQLEALCDAVTTYVQEFLQQPPESFWVSFSGLKDSSKVPNDSELTDFNQSSSPTKTFQSFTSQLPGKIYLESSSYLTHNLYLGYLANQASGPVIQLSLLQLFDLATALDEYSADVMALPTLNNRSYVRQLPSWAPVAAVLVVGVGLLPMTFQYANNIREYKPQTATKTAPAQEEIAQAPSLDFPTPQPGLTPPDNLQSLPSIGTTSPLSTSTLPQQPLTSSNSSFSTKSQSPISGLPPSSQPSANNASNIPPGTIPGLSSNQQGTASTTIPGQQIAIAPNLKQNSTRANSQSEIALATKRNLPSSLSSTRGSLSPNIPIVPPSGATIPSNSSALPPGYSAIDPSQLEERINSSGTSSTAKPSSKLPSTPTSSNDSLAARLRGESKTPTSPEVATGTLFDTPQIAEARNILTKRWQPPSGLTQTLEYSLIVGVDGTIERILPLNKSAREFVNSTGMPDIGKPFVSANRYGQNVRIRVVLTPDGKVQTFPESE